MLFRAGLAASAALLAISAPASAPIPLTPVGFVASGDVLSYPTGVWAGGATVVGFSYNGFSNDAFRWTAADGMAGLGTLKDSILSVATGVSGDGSVVVG